jgi:hypothetical protein
MVNLKATVRVKTKKAEKIAANRVFNMMYPDFVPFLSKPFFF